MENKQRASLIILLSMISKKTILTKFNVPKLANTSFYNVANKYDDIDFYISDFNDQDLKNELKVVFNSVWNEYMGEYVTDESLLEKDSFIFEKTGRLLYRYAQKHTVEEFIKDFECYNDSLNALNNEFAVMQLAEHFGRAGIEEKEMLKQKYYAETLFNAMNEAVYEEQEGFLDENKWAKREEDSVIKPGAKTKAKLLTYAILNGVVGVGYFSNKLLGNAFCVGITDRDGQSITTFHTKKHKELINQEFANKFFNSYLKTVGVNVEQDASLEEKEKLFVKKFTSMFNPENACAYLMAYVDKMVTEVNFGEDQIVSTAVALNVADALDGGTEGKKVPFGFARMSKEELTKVFDENFEFAKNQPKEAYARISKAYKLAKRTNREVNDIMDLVKGVLGEIFGNEDEESQDNE